MISVYYENLIGALSIDFADTSVTGNGTQTGTSSAPKSGRIYGYASRADYTSTYRFVDINLSQGSGHEVTLHSPKVEAGTTLTDFVATERTDMPTNSMHVKELIATGGLKVIGPTFADNVTCGQIDATSFTDVITNTIMTASGDLDIKTVLSARDIRFRSGSNAVQLRVKGDDTGILINDHAGLRGVATTSATAATVVAEVDVLLSVITPEAVSSASLLINEAACKLSTVSALLTVTPVKLLPSP